MWDFGFWDFEFVSDLGFGNWVFRSCMVGGIPFGSGYAGLGWTGRPGLLPNSFAISLGAVVY
ncbi:MAG: hypothetical protein A3J28_13010 [Acidobacteria bacterium RIFCSPLOWO2_12_FULL_60_22]|nr:MAG: hypothetical protein A3J28_13010 [Acidobacteria bacterium RIFCSPLOWO2_12_FULL_60_22]